MSTCQILGSNGFLWSQYDKHQLLEVRGNGTEIFYSGRDHHLIENNEGETVWETDRDLTLLPDQWNEDLFKKSRDVQHLFKTKSQQEKEVKQNRLCLDRVN